MSPTHYSPGPLPSPTPRTRRLRQSQISDWLQVTPNQFHSPPSTSFNANALPLLPRVPPSNILPSPRPTPPPPPPRFLPSSPTGPSPLQVLAPPLPAPPLPAPSLPAPPLRAQPSNRSRLRPTRRSGFPTDAHFGDPWPRPLPDTHFRIAYANINGFDTDTSNNPKVQQLRQWLQEINPDVFLGCEAQLNWSKMPWEASLDQWFRTQDPTRTICAYNMHEASTHQQRQYGGTFLLSRGHTSSRVVSMGTDPSNLGRWCWAQYKGRNDSTTFLYPWCTVR